MHTRPFRREDAYPIAVIKALCDLTDPLALFYRRTSNNNNTSSTRQNNKIWKAHVKSIKKSLELEILLPGSVCWVLELDQDDDHDESSRQEPQSTTGTTGNSTRIFGFAIWSRQGRSRMAQQWQAKGRRVSSRIKAFLSLLNLSITYPFDSSIIHSRMTQFHNRLKSVPFPSDRIEADRWDLEAMYIHPQYQRRGFGTRALQWGMNRAREEKVRIWVWSTDAGKKLYLNAGFKEIGRIEFGDLTRQVGPGGGDGQVTVWILVWSD